MKISIICSVLILALSGCVSVPNTPNPRFYMLRAVPAQVATKYALTPGGAAIVIGPIDIPEYQDRPQIVTQNKERMLNFAQFDRWGESLDVGLARTIVEDLTLMLPGANLAIFPANYTIPVKYQVIVDVLRLESDLDNGLLFVAQWSVIDAQSKQMVFTKRSEARRAVNPHSYAGLVDALSSVCGSLSAEMAEEISLLSEEKKMAVQ